jgi:hypothetical protein
MAITAALVCQRPERQRWLLTQDGAAGGTITFTTVTAGAAPNIYAQAPPGRIRLIAKVVENGYGSFAAGVQTQAKARALWLADRTAANPGSIERLQVARCEITPRTGTANPIWTVDANVDGGGNPILSVAGPATAADAYLDVEVEGGGIGA